MRILSDPAVQDAFKSLRGKVKHILASRTSKQRETKISPPVKPSSEIPSSSNSKARGKARDGNKESNKGKSELIHSIKCFLANIDTVENDDVINLLEGILADGIQLELGDIFKPILSPKNCLGISVLARHCCDNNLAKYVNNYISRNVDIVTKDISLENFAMKYFWKYLLDCDLEDAKKDLLIKAKLFYMLSVFGVESAVHNCSPQEDLEIIKITVMLSVNYPQFENLTTWCYRTLKNELSDSNCLDIAVLAQYCRLGEFKIWAEYHILSNFQALISNVLCNAYRHEVILRYLQESALPAALQEMISISYYNQSVLLTILTSENGQHSKSISSFDLSHFWELNSQSKQETQRRNKTKWLLSALKKLPSKKTQTIGIDGGIIELDGCSVSFPAGVLTTDVTITMLIDTNPEKYPDTGMAISPILSLEPSMSFSKPVYVKLQTCFGAEPGKTIPVSLFPKEHGSSWKLDRKVDVGSENFITFPVWHFSDECIATDNKDIDIDAGSFTLGNDIFIALGTGAITSCFYNLTKDRKDIKKAMRAARCSSFAKHPLKIKGKKDDIITLHIDMRKPVLAIDQESCVPGTPITMKEAYDMDEYYVDADPGDAITSHQGGVLSGTYKVFVGPHDQPAASALLTSEWPVPLDPEVTEPAICNHNITGFIANDNSTVHQKKENVHEILNG